jgi:excisionase family DNA binding protein
MTHICYPRCSDPDRGAAMESMMTVRQVAELLRVHENWVYDQAASGELPSYKIGGTRRFDPGEVRGWIAEQREADRPQPTQRKARTKTKRTCPEATRRTDGGQPTLFE